VLAGNVVSHFSTGRKVIIVIETSGGDFFYIVGERHGERRARAYNGGLGRSPQRGPGPPGAEPLVRGPGGEALVKLEEN